MQRDVAGGAGRSSGHAPRPRAAALRAGAGAVREGTAEPARALAAEQRGKSSGGPRRPAPDMLYVVGLGLGNTKDITVKGLEALPFDAISSSSSSRRSNLHLATLMTRKRTGAAASEAPATALSVCRSSSASMRCGLASLACAQGCSACCSCWRPERTPRRSSGQTGRRHLRRARARCT
jgi:hypothetical protein